MENKILKNPFVKNILSAIAVAGFGFILLNLAFIFDFLFTSLVLGLIKIFTPVDLMMTYGWFPPIMHGLYMIIIGLISWRIFKSKLRVLYKAIYLTVPTAAALVTVGMFLYRWPLVAFLTGGLLSAGVLYSFYRTKQPWLYYYTVILIAVILGIMGVLGVEI